jgi:hypothetical protein
MHLHKRGLQMTAIGVRREKAALTELERRVRLKHPAVVALFVKPQSSERFKEPLNGVMARTMEHSRYGHRNSVAGISWPRILYGSKRANPFFAAA